MQVGVFVRIMSCFVSYLTCKYNTGLNKALRLIMKTRNQIVKTKLAITRERLLLDKSRKNFIVNKNKKHAKYWKLISVASLLSASKNYSESTLGHCTKLEMEGLCKMKSLPSTRFF